MSLFLPSRLFIGLSAFEMMAMFRRGLFYAYLSIYLRHYLGLSVTETTLFATAPMITNIIFQTFVWGRISDRYQIRRTLIIAGEWLAALGTVTVWYLHRLASQPLTAGRIIIIGLAFIEIFWSMSNIGWSAMISDFYTPSQRSRIQGRLASIGGLGRMIGVWSGGLLYDGFARKYAGWGFQAGPLFFIASAVMLISTVPLFFMPEGGIASQNPGPAVSKPARLETGRHSALWLFLAAMVLVNFGRNAIAIILPQYLVMESGLGIDSRSLSNVVNVQSASIILFGLIVGRLSEKFGDKRLLLSAIGAAIGALLTLALSMRIEMIYLANFVRGATDVVIMATSYSLASILIPAEKRARLFSFYNATFFLSWGLAGTLVAGPLIDLLIAAGKPAVFAYRASFVAASVITTAGLLPLALIWRRLGRR